jgi:hypothetical protein
MNAPEPKSTVYFNGDLTLLKSSRNARPVPYSQWGGTDHEELRGPRQRRGLGPSVLRQAATAEASRSRAFSPAKPLARNLS